MTGREWGRLAMLWAFYFGLPVLAVSLIVVPAIFWGGVGALAGLAALGGIAFGVVSFVLAWDAL
jgi:hypothetical protein